MMEVGL